jgi:hypothetical protein
MTTATALAALANAAARLAARLAETGAIIRRGVHPSVESVAIVSARVERAELFEALVRLGAGCLVADRVVALVEAGRLSPEDAVSTASNPRAELIGGELVVWADDGVGHSPWGHPVYW